MSGRLQGKVAVVTGASAGIGAAIARLFGREGASVAVDYIENAGKAESIVAEITSSGGKAIAVKASLREPADVTRLFATAVETFGRLDILVNNAGVYEFAPIEKLTLEAFRKHMELNVFGYLLAIREAVPHFGTDGGSIVNMSSTVTSLGPSNASIYTASKGAIDGLTRALSNELAPRKIRVNAVKPGVVETEGLAASHFLDAPQADLWREQTPLKRFGTPDDIAPAVVYLASDESAWMTGEFVILGGGQR